MFNYDYVEDYRDYDPGDWVHLDDLPDLDFCCEQLKKVIETVYGSGELNVLESALEEICSQLGVSFPNTDLKIKKAAGQAAKKEFYDK